MRCNLSKLTIHCKMWNKFCIWNAKFEMTFVTSRRMKSPLFKTLWSFLFTIRSPLARITRGKKDLNIWNRRVEIVLKGGINPFVLCASTWWSSLKIPRSSPKNARVNRHTIARWITGLQSLSLLLIIDPPFGRTERFVLFIRKLSAKTD